MAKKYLMISIEGEESKRLASVLSSDVCKKILSLLAEKEASENDLALQLKMPINTVEYNLKKLLEVGLVGKSKNFFWSRKGKRIEMYRTANKSILIAPKFSLLKSIAPAAILSVIIAFLIKIFYSGTRILSAEKIKNISERVFDEASSVTSVAAPEAAGVAQKTATGLAQVMQNSYVWLFFLAGALTALAIFLILNKKKF